MAVEVEEIRNQVEYYGEQVLELLDASNDDHQALVQKGLHLYRQGMVYALDITSNHVETMVQDVTPFEVVLDLLFPVLNECTCPVDGICRHEMAVFFSLYSKVHSVEQWLDGWRNAKALKLVQGLKRGSDLLKDSKPELSGYEKWLSFYQSAYASLDSRNPYLLEMHTQNAYRNLLRKGPVEREWKPLYQLFTAYFSYKELNRIVLELEEERDFDKTHMLSIFQYFLDEAEEAVDRLTVTTMPFAFDDYIAFLREDLPKLIEDTPAFRYETIELYRVLWTQLFKNTAWRKSELARLQDLTLTTFEEDIAAAHLSLLLREDEAALEILEELEVDALPYLPYWLKWLGSHGQMRRYKQLLQFAVEWIPDFLEGLERDFHRVSFTRFFLDSIDQGFLEKEDSSFMENLYIKLLPYSYHYYREFLSVKKQYKKLLELEVMIGNGIDDLDKGDVKTINTEAPHLLLPFYHTSVSRFLEERNRDSYKKAVKHLKKLRTIYRKEKKLPQWEHFFQNLLDQTKRLRAFHEECRKGKLIDGY
ncbi:SWIM zinc finger family protein [Falsibacillus pallidus]|uniref:SWIM zinc finger family protein n=1 Tax=Falsibacillus pallidus TaxID=493781 RepID=UPI003D998B5D